MGQRLALGLWTGLALSIGCSTSSADPRCSLPNCHVLENCKVALIGEPRELALCFPPGGPGSVDPGAKSLDDYCVEACQADGEGALLDCVGKHFAQSCPGADGGYPNYIEISDTCSGVGGVGGECGTNCAACQVTCETNWTACNETCPDAGVCLDCEYACSQAQIDCTKACPTN